MNIADVLRTKGGAVVTILPTDTIEAAAQLLASKRIGAVLVRDRRGKIVGILSERDVVRGVADRKAEAMADPVQDLMTPDVKTCKPSDTIKEIMQVMTMRRIRHLPVMEGEELVGMVSIGDIVKARLEEQAQEVAVLRDISLVR